MYHFFVHLEQTNWRLSKLSWNTCVKRFRCLTHWGRVTHICVSKLTINGSDNGLPPDRRQAIIWTNAGILLIRTLGRNFSEILGEIHSFSFKKMHSKMSSAKGRLFDLGLNELTGLYHPYPSWLNDRKWDPYAVPNQSATGPYSSWAVSSCSRYEFRWI